MAGKESVGAWELGLAGRIAEMVFWRFPGSVPEELLRSTALSAIEEARSRFDPTNGASFERFAYRWAFWSCVRQVHAREPWRRVVGREDVSGGPRVRTNVDLTQVADYRSDEHEEEALMADALEW